MLDGKPPEWAGEAYRLPSGEGYDYGVRGPETPPQPDLPIGAEPQQQPPAEPINTEQPPVDMPPPASPPPQNIPPVMDRQLPALIRPDPEPPRQNAAIVGANPTPQKPPATPPPMLNTYAGQPTPSATKERGFLDNLLYNLGYGYAQLFSSFTDVNEIGKTLKRPSSDIVSIYHTRGDWDNIAKTHGLTKKEVQLVKVAFNE